MCDSVKDGLPLPTLSKWFVPVPAPSGKMRPSLIGQTVSSARVNSSVICGNTFNRFI